MRALVLVTGRGLGGDAVIALNTIKYLEKNGIKCEIALDENAQGLLFEKNGYSWHKISIPQAGGHAATKLSAVKGAFKLITAAFRARKNIKRLDVDFVVGIIGGGAIVGSVGAKLARKPAFSLVSTPLDSQVCPKFNKSFAFPEINQFRLKDLPKNMDKSYFPISEKVFMANSDIALQKLKEYSNFDENKKTIVFSSGSSIFKGMISAINIASDTFDEFNLVLVGLPLHDEYLDLINDDKIIYVGYIDWLNHLFKFADLCVLTDDGISLEEALVCHCPIISLTKVKWGRYQNMAGIYKGAIIESEIEDVSKSIKKAFESYDSLKKNTLIYAQKCSSAGDVLVSKILKEIK